MRRRREERRDALKAVALPCMHHERQVTFDVIALIKSVAWRPLVGDIHNRRCRLRHDNLPLSNYSRAVPDWNL